MNGTIVAINRQLGAVVAETQDHKCVVLGTIGRITADIGDVLRGDWSEMGNKVIDNVTQGTQMQMVLQAVDITRNEAIGRVTII
ncbi:hypothetical protein [Magnetovibrio sp.]|uniref:hypothetical protein n=1 Tax=Magnetovibrio sp. TaxID=2024836 RepID=UPI002F94AF8E